MDRGRDRRGYNDRESGYGGETYRPTERPRSPRGYRDRSPPPQRRDRSPPPYRGGYSSRGGRFGDRARSRSPPRRRSRTPVRESDNDQGYRGRPRSPPRNTGRARSPPPYRRQSRSPGGGRSRPRSPYMPRKERDRSPSGNYRRSPPPKQGRFAEERDDYGGRRSYGRDEPKRFPHENNYRPRERSRSPAPRMSAHTSRGATPDSRHSGSGQLHPDRLERVHDRPRRQSLPYRSPHQDSASDRRSPGYTSRDRSPPPRKAYSPPPRSPVRQSQEEHWRDRSPPPSAREREVPTRPRGSSPRNNNNTTSWSQDQVSTPRYQNGESRAPPTGPRERHGSDYGRDGPPTPSGPLIGPPTGPSMGNHPRGNILSAPTRPSRDSGYRGRGRGHYSGPPTPRTASYDRDPNAPPPTGPRGSGGYSQPHSPPPRYDSGGPPSRYDSGPPAHPHSPYGSGHRGSHHGYAPPPFRSNNSTSTTYPRTQRFNVGGNSANSHLASLSQPVEGGRKPPSMLDPAQEKRLQQLEDDKRKLEEAIEEKQRGLRHGLREWDRVEREAKREGLKSQLAEEHLAKLSGEVGGGAGAY